ncbi:MAG: hypothetical protein WCZ89_08825 [Phycisphaerae bacterium]
MMALLVVIGHITVIAIIVIAVLETRRMDREQKISLSQQKKQAQSKK